MDEGGLPPGRRRPVLCICRQDLLECAQDPSVASDACRASQALRLSWQACPGAYLDYQLDEKTDCFQVFPSWTGNEPRKESVDWAYIKTQNDDGTGPVTADSATRACASGGNAGGSLRRLRGRTAGPRAREVLETPRPGPRDAATSRPRGRRHSRERGHRRQPEMDAPAHARAEHRPRFRAPGDAMILLGKRGRGRALLGVARGCPQ